MILLFKSLLGVVQFNEAVVIPIITPQLVLSAMVGAIMGVAFMRFADFVVNASSWPYRRHEPIFEFEPVQPDEIRIDDKVIIEEPGGKYTIGRVEGWTNSIHGRLYTLMLLSSNYYEDLIPETETYRCPDKRIIGVFEIGDCDSEEFKQQ